MISRGGPSVILPNRDRNPYMRYLVELSEKSRGADRGYETNELDSRLRYAGPSID